MSSQRQRTGRSTTTKPKEQPPKTRGFGRPEDDALETFFMKKLRNCKLQVINAESQAQIQFFKFQDANPEAITQRKLTNDDDDYSKQKMLMVKNWFKEIDNDHYELLWNSFKHGVQTWQFKQITSEKDFPEYLFCDECDLSYVLYTALNSPIQALKNKTQFTQTQLLFFQLLCFAARDQISFRVIKSFKEITDQITKNMSGVKQKVILHYKNSILAEKDEEKSIKNQDSSSKKMDQIMQHQGFPLELIKGAAVKIPNEEEEKKFKNMKTKKIEKEQKQPRVGRPKNKVEVLEETIQFKDIQILLHKLITHIAWAYRYIYPEEEKKKQLLSAQ